MLNSSKYMGINKKNNTTKKNKSFDAMRVENLKKQLGKIEEKPDVVNSKQTNYIHGKNNLSNNSLENTPLLQTNKASQNNNSSNPKELDKWTTYLAYLLKQENNNNNKKNKTKTTLTVCKYEALLTQCSYLSRMAYTPAEVFCRMTQFLDLNPTDFNDYIRVIEKIMENKVLGKMINYECSYNSLWLMNQASYQSLFDCPKSDTIKEEASDDKINGFFLRNNKNVNVYIYYHHNKNSQFNNTPTIYVAFKGASSIREFLEGGLKLLIKDISLSELGINGTNPNSKAGRTYVQFLNDNTTENNVPLIKEVFDKVQTLLSKDKNSKIIITGHSLGGAFAVLFAFYYMKRRDEKTNPNPVHLITLGETTVMNAFARNEFNQLLNSSDEGRIFTYDRIESTTKKGGIGVWRNMFTKLPADLNHAGYSILQSERYPFEKTGRTNEISELRALCGMINDSDGKPTTTNTENDTQEFINLFDNKDNYSGDKLELYKKKLRVLFGTNKSSQFPIIEKALPDGNMLEVKNLFKQIEDVKAINNSGKEIELKEIELKEITTKQPNQPNQQEQSGGGLFSSISKLKNKTIGIVGMTEENEKYKKLALQMMPNQVIYDCNRKISLASCVGSYMGVSYMPVLRLPKIKLFSSNNKLSKNRIVLKKEPKVNYTLYKIDNRLYSINDKKDANCVGSFFFGSKYKNKNPTSRNPQNPNSRNQKNPNSRNQQNPNSLNQNQENSIQSNQENQNSQKPKSNNGSSCSIL